MAVDVRALELDRIVTMLKSFGWMLTNSEMAADRVQARFQKIMEGKTRDVLEFEVKRVQSMLTAAGWSMTSSSFPAADQATASFEKVFKAG